MRKQIAIIDTGGNVKTERMEKKMFLFPKNVKRIGSANIWWAHWLSITTRMNIKKGGAHTDQPRFAEHSTDTPKMKTIPALISEIVCEMLQKRPNWESFLLIFFASLPVDISLSVFDFLFYRWCSFFGCATPTTTNRTETEKASNLYHEPGFWNQVEFIDPILFDINRIFYALFLRADQELVQVEFVSCANCELRIRIEANFEWFKR